MRKMRSYATGVKSECAGLLYVNNESKTNPIIEDAVILKQEATSGSVDITKKALVKYFSKLAEEKPEDICRSKGWWHSHYDFGVFWSPTDDNTFRNFLDLMPRVYGIVVNANGDMLARADIKCSGQNRSYIRTYNNIKTTVPRIRATKKLKEEAKKLVKKKWLGTLIKGLEAEDKAGGEIHGDRKTDSGKPEESGGLHRQLMQEKEKTDQGKGKETLPEKEKG